MATPAIPGVIFPTDSGLVTGEKVFHAVQKIIAKADSLWIAAFGSRARGTHHAESDLDLQS